VKIGKLLAVATAAASLLAAMVPGVVLANGVGDLYVASSAGVLEVHVATSTVISTIPMTPAPQSLAFSPDGRTLYASNIGSSVVPVDIATLDVQTSISLPGPVAGLAFPAGQVLVAAMPQRRTLEFVTVHSGTMTESATLPGSGNLIAADRRDARIAVAEAGASWLEIVDPATSTMKKTTVTGGIVALAIERDRGGAIVATRSPNEILRIDLTSLETTWSVAVPAAPTAVAAMATTVVAAGASTVWSIDGADATTLAATRQPVLAMTASDEGSVIHVAEATGIEVFDSTGKLQRTLELNDERAPVAMSAVPRGSSLFLGQGAGASPSAGAATPRPASVLATPEPPPTSTIVDSARDLAGSPPFQGAAVVAAGILFLCWVFVRWYDRRRVQPS
jgi:hypothetical protein